MLHVAINLNLQQYLKFVLIPSCLCSSLAREGRVAKLISCWLKDLYQLSCDKWLSFVFFVAFDFCVLKTENTLETERRVCQLLSRRLKKGLKDK